MSHYKYSVLIADSDAIGLGGIRDLLVSLGHEVDCASDGLQALDLARTGRFEVVLVGRRLSSLDGAQVAGELRAHPPPHPVKVFALPPMLRNC